MRNLLAVTFILCLAGVALGQDHPSGKNVSDMKFGTVPGLPTCITGDVVNGDPAKGAYIVYARIKAGCTVPWHWHTASEHLMVVSGAARIDVKDEKSFTLRPGGFTLMPAHHQHQASCPKACSMFVYSDAAFDIHYVNKEGAEISPDDALKPLKQTAAKPPQ